MLVRAITSSLGRNEPLSGGLLPINRSGGDIMDHSTHTRLRDDELNESVLEDATIYGPNDEKVGSVSHVHGTGLAAKVIIDGGGFLGIGAKPVAVPASQLDFMRDEAGDVHAVTTWTKDQLENMPEHQD
jgi:hypothetical protein